MLRFTARRAFGIRFEHRALPRRASIRLPSAAACRRALLRAARLECRWCALAAVRRRGSRKLRAGAAAMTLTVLNVAYALAPVADDAVGGSEQVLLMLDRALVEAGHHS